VVVVRVFGVVDDLAGRVRQVVRAPTREEVAFGFPVQAGSISVEAGVQGPPAVVTDEGHTLGRMRAKDRIEFSGVGHTDTVGYQHMPAAGRQFPDRVWVVVLCDVRREHESVVADERVSG
jgi:hypothetical protein